MNISKEKVIKYIEDKKTEREQSLLGLDMTARQQKVQNMMFLGVDMVIRWINEIQE
jgi:hypothetical protein